MRGRCYLDCYWYILWEALNRQIEGAILVVVLVYGADNLPANLAFPACITRQSCLCLLNHCQDCYKLICRSRINCTLGSCDIHYFHAAGNHMHKGTCFIHMAPVQTLAMSYDTSVMHIRSCLLTHVVVSTDLFMPCSPTRVMVRLMMKKTQDSCGTK